MNDFMHGKHPSYFRQTKESIAIAANTCIEYGVREIIPDISCGIRMDEKEIFLHFVVKGTTMLASIGDMGPMYEIGKSYLRTREEEHISQEDWENISRHTGSDFSGVLAHLVRLSLSTTCDERRRLVAIHQAYQDAVNDYDVLRRANQVLTLVSKEHQNGLLDIRKEIERKKAQRSTLEEKLFGIHILEQ